MVINRLNSIRRNFLWQGNKERKGYHLVKWKAMIEGKKLGGMQEFQATKQGSKNEMALEVL